ncbi:MAG TPA: hypothetical protein VIJ66_03525 [Solirubrobacteraceae bacterium]
MSDEHVPPSDEVLAHVEHEMRDACRLFRAAAERLSNPLAVAVMLEKADEMDAETEELLRRIGRGD